MDKLPKGQYSRVIARLEAAGLNRVLVQKLLTDPDNKTAKAMIKAAQTINEEQKNEQIDLSANFEKISEFKFIPPIDYSLASFRKKYQNSFGLFDSNLTDENFTLSRPLEMGQTKTVTIYRLNKIIPGKDCLAFAKKKDGLLNAPILAAIWEQNPEAFSRKLWFVGLDDEKFLYQNNTMSMMPILGHMSGKPCFDFLPLTESLEPGFCIVLMN